MTCICVSVFANLFVLAADMVICQVKWLSEKQFYFDFSRVLVRDSLRVDHIFLGTNSFCF